MVDGAALVHVAEESGEDGVDLIGVYLFYFLHFDVFLFEKLLCPITFLLL